MRIEFEVKSPNLLRKMWRKWANENEADLAQIQENGGLTSNEPHVAFNPAQKQGLYVTASGKGVYAAIGKNLVFTGYRNSFGNTKFFAIATPPNTRGVTLQKTPETDLIDVNVPILLFTGEPDNPTTIELELISFATSKIDKPFMISPFLQTVFNVLTKKKEE